MKARIDGQGWLSVDRSGYEKEQHCPFGHDAGIRCGDWCPHFGEITRTKEKVSFIEICHGKKIMFSKITDER